MVSIRHTTAYAGALLAAIAGSSTDVRAQAERAPFTGPGAGIEAGYLEHHFALEIEQYDARGTLVASDDRYYRSHGIGGGVFGGYDIALSPRLRAGLELGVTAGGRTSTADLRPFGTLSLVPRFGATGAVRVGYLLTPRIMAYALTGYGGNAYRVRDTARVADSGDFEWGSSFIVGAGAEYRLSDRIGIRIDGRHVDNQTWRVFAGLPIRF